MVSRSRRTARFRGLGASLLLAGTLLSGGCGQPTPETDELSVSRVQTTIRTAGPSVILITLVGARPDHMSLYGYDRDTTPNLKRIAADALVYDDAVSPAGWTVPAHASMFTGLYPWNHGADSREPKLAREFQTLPEILWEAGFATAGATNHPNVSGRAGLFQGFEDSVALYPRHRDAPDDGAGLAVDWTLQWVDGRQGSEQRFFLYVNFIEPSFPYRPPVSHDQRYLPPGTDPAMVADLKSWKRPRDMGYMLGVAGMEISETQLAVLRALYDAELAYLDERLGELYDGLVQRGLLDDTILVIVGDVGEHLGEHRLLEHKMSLYEPIVHVPLIVRYPAAFPRGGRIATQVQTLDLLPTILELADVPYDGPVDGLPLPGQGEGGREFTYASFADPSKFLESMTHHFPGADLRPFQRSLRMIRGERYKLIRPSSGPVELYDLSVDRGEQRNLAGEQPDVRKDLERRLNEFAGPP